MFDGLESSFTALNQPSAIELAHVLRHKKLWPVGFEWDYRNDEKCAIGLMEKLWFNGYCCDHTIAATLKLSHDDVYNIFYRLHKTRQIPRRKIKPKHVAKAIERAYKTHCSEANHGITTDESHHRSRASNH
jgi:hypothetical protein